jgi:hypothetical protein
MTSGPHSPSIPPQPTPHLLRLRLKPKGPVTGYVDGAWWPRTRDLTAELPELAAVLAVRLGPVYRVAFAMAAWLPPPTRRLVLDGRPVRLEGFRSQDENIVYVSGLDGRRICLLVVPPEADDAAGHEAMMTAAHRDNADSPAEILSKAGIPSRRRGAPERVPLSEAAS